jgi:hypothetical protein
MYGRVAVYGNVESMVCHRQTERLISEKNNTTWKKAMENRVIIKRGTDRAINVKRSCACMLKKEYNLQWT